MRLLRKVVDEFFGVNDPAAVVIYDGAVSRSVLDWHGLVDGQTYYYAVYWKVGNTWLADDTVAVVPNHTDTDLSVDVLSVVRERLDAGLRNAVAAGELKGEQGRIMVLTAPPTYDNVGWPVVTVHVNSDSSDQRAVGEGIARDEFRAEPWDWYGGEGWLSRWSVAIIGWSLNPDERIALRKIIKRIVVGNLAVFDDAGMLQIDLQQQDIEEFERYSAPVYQSVGTLTCLAPTFDAAAEVAIREVVTTVTASNPTTP